MFGRKVLVAGIAQIFKVFAVGPRRVRHVHPDHEQIALFRQIKRFHVGVEDRHVICAVVLYVRFEDHISQRLRPHLGVEVAIHVEKGDLLREDFVLGLVQFEDRMRRLALQVEVEYEFRVAIERRVEQRRELGRPRRSDDFRLADFDARLHRAVAVSFHVVTTRYC